MLKRFKPKSEFTRNVLTLMTGTTIAQAIPIAISPILTRIYSPEDFGVFALYMSLASILSVIATGRYELAIMLPKKDGDAKSLVVLSILITIGVTFLSFVLIYLFHDKLVQLLDNESISIWLYFVPLSVLLTGVYQSLNFWYNRKKQYKLLSISKVTQTSTTATINLGMGFSKFGSSGLILGFLLGQIASIFILKIKLSEFILNRKKMIILAKKYKKLPLYNLPNAIVDTFRMSGITILIAKFFTTSTLGQFSLAWRMLQAPMSLVGSSLSQVFFQQTSQAKRDELYNIVKKFIIKSSLISLPLFLIIYFFASDIFMIVFGSKWMMAGEVASALSPWLFFNFITSPLSTIFITINRQETLLLFAIFYAVLPLGLIYCFHSLDFIELLHYLSFLMSALLAIFIGLVLYLSRKQDEK